MLFSVIVLSIISAFVKNIISFTEALVRLRICLISLRNLAKMLFPMSELANKAEITILSARDTTRYKTGYNTWLSSRLQNQPRSFLSFRLVSSFSCSVLSFTGTMHPVW